MQSTDKKIIIILVILLIILISVIGLGTLFLTSQNKKSTDTSTTLPENNQSNIYKTKETAQTPKTVLPAGINSETRLFLEPVSGNYSPNISFPVSVKLDVGTNTAYVIGAHLTFADGLTVDSCDVDPKYSAAPGYAQGCSFDNSQKTIDLTLVSVSGSGEKGISNLATLNFTKENNTQNSVDYIKDRQKVFIRLADGSAVSSIVSTNNGNY